LLLFFVPPERGHADRRSIPERRQIQRVRRLGEVRPTIDGQVIVTAIALKIATRIMGLLLASVAMQFMINALTQLKGTLF
jgi:hypothetical protein